MPMACWRTPARRVHRIILKSYSYYLPSQILPNEGEPVPGVQGALQGVGNVQYGVIHQHFDVLGQVPRPRVPERLVQLGKAPAQTAQDLADRVAVSEGS